MGGLTLICAAGSALYFASFIRAQEIQRSGYSLNTKARAAAGLLVANIRSRQLEVDLIRQYPILTQGALNSQALRDFLELRSMFHNEYAWLGIVDRNGTVQQATSGVLVGTDVTARPWFQASMKGELYLGDVHEAVLLANKLTPTTSGQPIRLIDISAPFFGADGKIRGVIAAHAQWGLITEEIESMVVKQAGAYDAELLIANDKGQILYPVNARGTQMVPADLRESVPFMDVIWNEGASYRSSLIHVSPVKNSDFVWKVIVRTPSASSSAMGSGLTLLLIAYVLTTTALFAGLAYFLSSDLQRALRRLGIEITEAPNHPLADEIAPVRYKVSEVSALSEAVQELKSQHKNKIASLVNENASVLAQLHEKRETDRQLSTQENLALQHDLQSGILPTEVFHVRLRTAFSVLLRKWVPFTVLMVQIDDPYFMSRNFGPDEGLAEIKKLASTIHEHCGRRSLLTRYRTDVFAVLLLELESKEESKSIAARVKEAVESVHRTYVKVGVATSIPQDTNAQNVLNRAMQALNEESQSGPSFDALIA